MRLFSAEMLPNGRNAPMLAVEIAVRARMACIHSVCGAFMPKKGALDESTANIGPVLPFEGGLSGVFETFERVS